MSYTRYNYPTKKALKTAVATLIANPNDDALRRDLTLQRIEVAGATPTTGTAFLEGPHYPLPHRWYAKVQVLEGVVIKVLS